MGRVADPRPDGLSQGLTWPTAQGSVPHAFTGRPKALKISAGLATVLPIQCRFGAQSVGVCIV